jgi:4-amino-4-deoxy-L-arabinose transferase-like glycosyltransferase
MKRVLLPVTVFLLVLGGTALRVRVAEDLPLDADESIAGLMARNIAFRGEAPLFFYGEHYVGTASQFVVAFLFQAFGFHPAYFRVLEFALAAVFLLLGYVIAARAHSQEAGLWTLLLLALPPVFLSIINLKSWGNYNETFCLGGLLWWLVLVLVKDDPPRSWRSFLGYWVWGLAFGLGFWIHFPIVIYALPCGVFLLVFGEKEKRMARWFVTIVGFLMGWFPALWYNLTNNFANLGYAGKGSWDYLTRIEASGEQFERLVVRGLPFLLGSRSDCARFIDFQQFDPVFARFFVLGGFFFLFIMYLYRQELLLKGWFEKVRFERGESGRRCEVPHGFLPVLMLLLVVLFTIYGRWGGRSFTPRYYSFAYLPLFVIAGQMLVVCRKKFFSATVLWVGFFLYSNLYGHTTFLNHPPARTAERVAAYLEEEKIPTVFTDYWLAHTVTFLTNERVIGSVHGGPVRHERYARYSSLAEEASEAAYAMYSDLPEKVDDTLRSELGRLGVQFQEKQIDNVTVFHHLSRKVNPYEMSLFYRY